VRFQSFWSGPELTPLEQLCVQSFLEHGYGFVLYAYGDVANVPDGCSVENAEEILPEDDVFLHDEGIHAESVGAFSDVFRYHLLRARGGWWVDTDVICLRGDVPESEYVFAEQESGLVNGAILRAPAGSRLLALACERSRAADTGTRFGSVGPRLLTDVVGELGLASHAWPGAALYPIGWNEALDTLDPDRRTTLEERSMDSYFFHLWGEMLRVHNVLKTVRPPGGSYLAAMYERYGIEFPPAPRYDFSQLRPQRWLQEQHWAMKEELTRLYERSPSD
jgi:Glycosyltransferase sugar-binding region containing DXD motif